MSMPHECECRTCGHTMAPFFYPPVPVAAGHCGKCGAPYTVENLVVGPTKFIPSCKCWNL